jgi:hypothetical protein
LAIFEVGERPHDLLVDQVQVLFPLVCKALDQRIHVSLVGLQRAEVLLVQENLALLDETDHVAEIGNEYLFDIVVRASTEHVAKGLSFAVVLFDAFLYASKRTKLILKTTQLDNKRGRRLTVNTLNIKS